MPLMTNFSCLQGGLINEVEKSTRTKTNDVAPSFGFRKNSIPGKNSRKQQVRLKKLMVHLDT